MNPTHFRFPWALRSIAVCACALAGLFAAGCAGGSANSHSGQKQVENTSVTVMISSTANDQLAEFNLFLDSITLTSESGDTVSLLAAPQQAEFIHLNGSAEPLATVSVPQGTYTSATATIGAASFFCVTYISSEQAFDISIFAYGYVPGSQVTVNLPASISVSGSEMGLLLDLQVLQSASYASCAGYPGESWAITPTFNLTPVAFASQPTSPANGKMTGLNGIVSSVDLAGNNFTVASADGPATEILESGATVNSTGIVWQLASTGSTVFQGVSGLSALAVGMPVNMDAEMQPDGSLQATRVEVEDTDINDLSVTSGPLLEVISFEPVVVSQGTLEQGPLYTPGDMKGAPFSVDGAAFKISGQVTNLANLPFTPNFSAASMVAGQNVAITTHAASFSSAGGYPPAATLTLMPQTVNGTVSAVSTANGFTIYTVTLAPYDLFPTLAFTDYFQTSPLTDPNTVIVYADANTQMLNTGSATVGSLLRFTGLVLNDNGTLRMDCSKIDTGVTE